MENTKNKNIFPISHNTTENELFKPSDIISTNYDEFSFPQGKDVNILLEYYSKKKGNGDFMDKIGKLNKKFYNCSENYIKSKKRLEKLNDDLYMNLFKQIDCYVEEIERLNKKIAANNNQELKKTIEKLNKDISEQKEKIRNFEIRLKEKTENEEKLKKEIESYKRRIIFYKDKINIGLLSRQRNIDLKDKNGVPFFTIKKNIQKSSYLIESSEKKIKSYFDKNNINTREDLSSKVSEKIDNKEDIIYEKEEKSKDKSNNKIYKLKESVFKTDDNYYPSRGKNFTDMYDQDNDIIEKNEEAHSYNEDDLNLNIGGYSQNVSCKISNLQSKDILSDKGNEDNNRTFDDYNKKKMVYDNQLKKERNIINDSVAKYKKSEIKSKIINQQKIEKKYSNVVKIDIDVKNTNKFRKNDKLSNQKPENKTSYIITKVPDSNTPYIKNKYMKNYIPQKVRPISIKTKEIRKDQINNNKFNTHQNDYTNKRLKEVKVSDFNQSNLNKTNNQIKKNHKIFNRKSGKNDNKDLDIILKAVNDDYLNSIEMLTKQEEQIKAMLKLMDLKEK